MKYQKQFEEYLTKYPHLKGGNSFQMDGNEYSSSWMQVTYESLAPLFEELDDLEEFVFLNTVNL